VTAFATAQRTVRVRGRVIADVGPLATARGQTIDGYEIHTGRTRVEGADAPFSIVERGGSACSDRDGALGSGGAVMGTYLHGLFANDGLRRALLGWLATRKGDVSDPRWAHGQTTTPPHHQLPDA